MKEIIVKTNKKVDLIDITAEIEKELQKEDIKNGIVFLFVLHTTAGLLINENEEGLKRDWISSFHQITSKIDYLHNQLDGNGPAHIFASLIGQEKLIPVKDGKLLLGTWQRIFLFELDGPRTRKIILQIIKN